jgi:glyoxylase-like metal-dependent hydrolase (beta-lactamase superfamily II)
LIEFSSDAPQPGETVHIAAGVHWLRVPLPFKPHHINLWLLEDEDERGRCWTIVDTGFNAPASHAIWDKLFVGLLAAQRVSRIIVTHHHPDHVGCARMLAERTGAMVWMTTGEYLSAHAAASDIAGFDRASNAAHFMRHGLGRLLEDQTGIAPAPLSPRAAPLPNAYRRLVDGEVLRIGARSWRVMSVLGHSPEHAALFADEGALLISGDQVLPTITPNISVWSNQPEGNPLQQYLDSLARFESLPQGTQVLPSHGGVFRGLLTRIAALRSHHRNALAELADAIAQPRCAAEILPVLFKRPLDDVQRILAMGEAIAHLHCLWHSGQAHRTIDANGLICFQRA